MRYCELNVSAKFKFRQIIYALFFLSNREELRSADQIVFNMGDMINIANLSPDHPIWVEEKEYNSLISRKTNGWSQCDTQIEWMAKLHYLRTGYKSGKIEKSAFFNREKDLVINWWGKWL